MFGRERTGSILCPSCGMLVGVNDAECLGCGRRRPGRAGLGALLGPRAFDDLFVPLVMWGCGALYLASLAMDPSSLGASSRLMSILAPSLESVFVLGASGGAPVFLYKHWWSVL